MRKIKYFFIKSKQSNSSTLEEVDEYFTEFEISIIEDNTYNQDDKRVLLSVIATARYSSCFWYNYFNVETNNSTTAKRKWWQWLIVGVADVIGAGVGAIPATATAGVLEQR